MGNGISRKKKTIRQNTGQMISSQKDQVICHFCKNKCLKFADLPPSYLQWTQVSKNICYLPENRRIPLPTNIIPFEGWICHKCILVIIESFNCQPTAMTTIRAMNGDSKFKNNNTN